MSVNPNTLPDLSSDYALPAEKIAQFREQGHIMLPAVCSVSEIEVYREVLNKAAYSLSSETRPMEERDSYGKAFLQIMNLWTQDEAVKKFTLARRFARIAAQLLGVKGVRLYHDQALYKEAKGGHTPWHQDQYYWPLDSNNTITMWMPLVDVPIDMGALTFATGSHREGYLGNLAISDESHAAWGDLVKERGYPVHNEPMKAGDCTFHYGWTLHTAPGNSSDKNREVMTVIYYEDGINTLVPDNPNRQDDLAGWLPGVQGGELAVSPLNPLLYREE